MGKSSTKIGIVCIVGLYIVGIKSTTVMERHWHGDMGQAAHLLPTVASNTRKRGRESKKIIGFRAYTFYIAL